MDEADLATVMEWDFEWEVLVGEGVDRRWRGGGGCDHTKAGWSKAIRDLFFFFSPAAVWKGLRFELSHKEEGNYIEKEEQGRRVVEEKGRLCYWMETF